MPFARLKLRIVIRICICNGIAISIASSISISIGIGSGIGKTFNEKVFYPARVWARRACAQKALGQLLADGALTVE